MTFPSRKPTLTLVRRETLITSNVDTDAEKAWRDMCAEFLYACFNGAERERIQTLGQAVVRARDVMLRNY